MRGVFEPCPRRVEGCAFREYFNSMQPLSSGEISRLSTEERLQLIGQLWDSLENTDVPLSAPQKNELTRRLSTLDQDRAEAVSWEELRAELARRCPE